MNDSMLESRILLTTTGGPPADFNLVDRLINTLDILQAELIIKTNSEEDRLD